MDCMKTEKLAENYSDVVYVPNGTVCFSCFSSASPTASPSFKINNQSVNRNYTRIINTTLLLVYNTTSIFTTDQVEYTAGTVDELRACAN